MEDLAGRLVAISGGAGDIGLATAAALARRGAEVVLLDNRPDGPDVAERLASAGLPADAYRQVDVTDRAAVDATLAALPRLDVAVANAGIVRAAPFLDVDVADWRTQLEVNLTGTFHLLQSAARLMVGRGVAGQVIVTGSWVADHPWPEISAYTTSKAGAHALARSAAMELAPYGVRVNVVAPGIVHAGMARRQYETEPQYAARAAGAIPLGRMQTADEVGSTIAFLCSDAAAYLTGTVLLADGGCSLFHVLQRS